MKKYFLILTVICLFSSIAWSEEMYFWTDANGKKHYGDAPPNEQKSQVESMKAHKFNERGYIEAEYKRSKQQCINESNDRRKQYEEEKAQREWKDKMQSNTVGKSYSRVLDADYSRVLDSDNSKKRTFLPQRSLPYRRPSFGQSHRKTFFQKK